MREEKKTVVLVSPELIGRGIALCAKSKGYRVIACEIDSAYCCKMMDSQYQIARYVENGLYDGCIIEDNWQVAARRIKEEISDVVAVISGSEIAVEYTDRIASYLHLPCNNPETIPCRRDKFCMKQAVQAAGLRVAKGGRFTAVTDAIQWIDQNLTYPVVVKTPAGSGSQNVFICHDEVHVRAKIATVLSTEDAHFRTADSVIVEEFIDGQEYAVDMFGTDGQVYITDLWQYHKISNKFADNLYNTDVLLDLNSPEYEQLESYAKKLYSAVGISIGPAHAEIKVDKNGPVIIEIASRLPGSDMDTYVHVAENIDVISQTIDVFVNGRAPFADPIKLNYHVGTVTVNSQQHGVLKRIIGLDKVAHLKTFVKTDMYVHTGDIINPTLDLDHALGIIWFKGKNYVSIMRDMAKAHELIRLETESSSETSSVHAHAVLKSSLRHQTVPICGMQMRLVK